MKLYKHVEEVSISQLDRYLSMGYEILETRKTVHEYGDETIYYHVGYPLEAQCEDLKTIISLYEQHGLKEVLFSKIAESIEESLNEYETSGGHSVDNELTKALELYERVVNQKPNVKYYKKLTQQEIEESYF